MEWKYRCYRVVENESGNTAYFQKWDYDNSFTWSSKAEIRPGQDCILRLVLDPVGQWVCESKKHTLHEGTYAVLEQVGGASSIRFSEGIQQRVEIPIAKDYPIRVGEKVTFQLSIFPLEPVASSVHEA